jgi:protein required for attachment to host cells
MEPAWVVVADCSQARIFRAPNAVSELVEVTTLEHPEARLRAQELETDAPGRANGTRQSAYNQSVVREHRADLFAKQVVACIKQNYEARRFNRVVWVAPPPFLGRLRQECDANLKRITSCEVDKDLVQKTPREIREILPKVI